MMASIWNWLKTLRLPKRPQGAEAVATIRFGSNDTSENIPGFIVKNNNDLTGLIDPRQSYLDKYKNTKYFVYVPSDTLPHCARSDKAEIKVLVSRDSQLEKEYLTCEVSALEGDDIVARVGSHFFIPCESVTFNTNGFLSKYSKTIMKSENRIPFNPTSRESIQSQFYGLKNNGEAIGITLVQLRQCKLDSNVLEVDDEVFDELIDGPLLNKDKTKLAGCLQKKQQKGQFRLDFFGMEESVHVWKASTLQSRATESDDSATSVNHYSKHDNNGVNGGVIDLAAVNSKNDILKSEDSRESSENVTQTRNLPNFVLDTGGSHGKHGQGKNELTLVRLEDIDERGTSGSSSSWPPGNSANGIAFVDTDGELAIDNSQPDPSSNHDIHGRIENAKPDSVSDNAEEMGDSNGELVIDDDELDDVHHYENMNACKISLVNDCREPIQVSKENSLVSVEHLPTEEQATKAEKHPKTATLKKVTFCEMYDYDSSVVQDLCKIFDKKNAARKDISSVADKLSAHPLIKDKCKSNYSHSPATELLKLPDVAMKSIGTLVSHLKTGQKELLAHKIEEKLKADLKEKDHTMTIEKFFNKHFELKEEIATKLEGCDDTFDWRWLANSFSLDCSVLEQIERGTDPAESFLREYAYHCLPRCKLQLGKFLKHMKDLGREKETLELFQKHGIKVEQADFYAKSLKDEYRPNTDRMDDLCKLLNKNNCKGWQCLAVLWGVKELNYSYYIPDIKASPTKILFDWLMMQKPDYTVDKLKQIFHELERHGASDLLDEKLAQYATSRPPLVPNSSKLWTNVKSKSL